MAYLVSARLNDSRVTQAISEIAVQKGDKIVLDIDGINEFAQVQICTELTSEEVENKVLRMATAEDILQNERNMNMQPQDKKTVLNYVIKNNLTLKLVSILRSLDGKKLLIIYTADERVDFRQLVRELANEFKMKIEMRQITEREEAYFFGGCGACGQPICCRRFLNQPKQTTIKMAKTQCTALNPNRINGLCGKLMCCLQYEHEQYQELLAQMPAINSKVATKDGEGKVEFNDCLRGLVAVRFADEKGVKKYPLDEVTVLEKKEKTDDE